MKEIKAYLRVFMVGDVIDALRREGYPRVTVLDVSAVAEPLWRSEREVDPALGLHTRMAKVELVCAEERVEKALRIIREAALTGNRGDGLITVSTVDHCLQIRTGRTGPDAL